MTITRGPLTTPTPPLAGLSDTEPLLPTEVPLYVAARRDHAADLAAELLLQRRPPGHELKPHAIVVHCEAAGRERDPLAVTPGVCPPRYRMGHWRFASNRRRVQKDVEGGDLSISAMMTSRPVCRGGSPAGPEPQAIRPPFWTACGMVCGV